MIQKYRKTDAKVRGRHSAHRRAATPNRQPEGGPIRRAAFDLIAYTAALEVLG